MSRTRIVALLVSLPLLAALVYLGVVVQTGIQRTDRIRLEIEALGRDGFQPEDLPDGWLADLLAIEDPNFHGHNGIDLMSPGAGMTTLTQGLVKIHYFEDFRPGLAKIPQSLWALVMDARVPKADQLLLFLNTAGLGSMNNEPVAGFPHAARAYFSRPLAALDHDQFLALVAMLIGPNRYHLSRAPGRNAERVGRIKRLLAGQCRATGMGDVYYSECATPATVANAAGD